MISLTKHIKIAALGDLLGGNFALPRLMSSYVKRSASGFRVRDAPTARLQPEDNTYR